MVLNFVPDSPPSSTSPATGLCSEHGRLYVDERRSQFFRLRPDVRSTILYANIVLFWERIQLGTAACRQQRKYGYRNRILIGLKLGSFRPTTRLSSSKWGRVRGALTGYVRQEKKNRPIIRTRARFHRHTRVSREYSRRISISRGAPTCGADLL